MRRTIARLLIAAGLVGVLLATVDAARGRPTVIIPPSGDGGLTNTLTSDLVSTSQTLADVSALAVPLAANGRVWLEYTLLIRTAATGTGFHFALNGPASPETVSLVGFFPYEQGFTSPETDYVTLLWSSFDADEGLETQGVGAADTDDLATIRGVVVNGANPGVSLPRWASEINASAVTLKAGSSVRYRPF
jgi:hypothetical protein